jgi:hypothetical protein
MGRRDRTLVTDPSEVESSKRSDKDIGTERNRAEDVTKAFPGALTTTPGFLRGDNLGIRHSLRFHMDCAEALAWRRLMEPASQATAAPAGLSDYWECSGLQFGSQKLAVNNNNIYLVRPPRVGWLHRIPRSRVAVMPTDPLGSLTSCFAEV